MVGTLPQQGVEEVLGVAGAQASGGHPHCCQRSLQASLVGVCCTCVHPRCHVCA